jgi:iron complex transport system ATP-binding protein
MDLLEFENISVLKGKNKVLDSLTVRIPKGENVAILGPNGAGKSSFIKTLTREYYPVMNEGKVTFRIWGEDVWNIFDLRNLLGIVSNDLQSVFAREITGMEVVLSGFFSSLWLYGQKATPVMKAKAQKILRFLEIDHLRDRKMTEMSSGEARRFLISRALVHDPKALVLDEPTNSLDLHSLDKFRRMMRKISKAGINIILVTQSLYDIIPEISRVILMRKGKFYQDGPKAKILTSQNISRLFGTPVTIRKEKGFFHAVGY